MTNPNTVISLASKELTSLKKRSDPSALVAMEVRLFPRLCPGLPLLMRAQPPSSYLLCAALPLLSPQFFPPTGATSRTAHYESKHFSDKWRLDMKEEQALGLMPPDWSTSSEMKDPRTWLCSKTTTSHSRA